MVTACDDNVPQWNDAAGFLSRSRKRKFMCDRG
jgi:hypothetical protein